MSILPERSGPPAIAAGAVCAVLAMPATAQVHPVELSIQVDDADAWSDVFLPDGENTATGVFNYRRLDYGNPANDDWSMDWDFNAAPLYDPASVVNANFVVRNTSADQTLEYHVRVTMPLTSPVGAGPYFGSAAITVASAGDGALATLPASSLFEADIDGFLTDTLFDADYVLPVPAGGGSADDVMGFEGEHPGGEATISIQLNFTLTPGAAMTITSAFTPGSTIDHNWVTHAGGGGVSTGGQYTITGDIGQPDAGTSSGGTYTLTGGFFAVFGPVSERLAQTCDEDLDASGIVDFADMLAVLSAFGSCDGCPEDIDEDGEVGFNDILMVLSAWGPCQ